MSDRHNQVLNLKSGRTIGFAEYGKVEGYPLIFCHGTPGSRFGHYGLDQFSLASNIRLIVPERPGYGLSQPYEWTYRVSGWASDLKCLLAALSVERFSIIGFSNGGAYALATASAMPDQIESLTLISSTAPIENLPTLAGMRPQNLAMLNMVQNNIAMLRQQLSGMAKNPELAYLALRDSYQDVDQQYLNNSHVNRLIRKDLNTALSAGINGLIDDLVAYAKPWELDLSSIHVPVDLWHGMADGNAPMVMADYLTQVLPECTSHLMANEGHISITQHWSDILT